MPSSLPSYYAVYTYYLLFWTTILTTQCISTIEAFSATLLPTTDHAPSWDDLWEDITTKSPIGQRLHMESEQRALGYGPPHTDAQLRLFDDSNNDETDDDDNNKKNNNNNDGVTPILLTFYRDEAAWCPYCQKVWIFLEERRIPYQVQKVPLNAYGDKPAWYTRKVDGGKLPAIELIIMDNSNYLYTESMDIMKLLNEEFPDKTDDTGENDDNADIKEAFEQDLFQLELELQSAWFSLVFYPIEGDALADARDNLLTTLDKVDEALSVHDNGPWFLGGNSPTIIDIHYIPTMERLIASCLYWKGLTIRGMGRFTNIDKWLAAFEGRPSYRATKSDYYTLVMSIPSQNGPGYMTDDAKNSGIADSICGLNGAWELPLSKSNSSDDGDNDDDKEARITAAFQLVSNHEQIVQFAARGAGEPGRPSYHAELADPYAEPNEDFVIPVDLCLRHVAAALLSCVNDDEKGTALVIRNNAKLDLTGKRGGDGELRDYWDAYEEDEGGKTYWWNEVTGETTWTPPTRQLDTCLAYLRDRIGVPRDMSEPAAMQLRAHLNWAIAILNENEE